MSAEVETMAYAGQTPWHGLGVRVSNDMTPEQMLKAAGLEWLVLKKPNYTLLSADGEKPRLKIVPGEYSLIRDTDEAYLDTVGENFKIPQNKDILGFFKRFVEAGDMQMETAGSLKGGKFIWALARINESFTLGKSDEIRSYLLLSQPHQYGFSYSACMTAIRIVCWNTITSALGSNMDGSSGNHGALFRMRHSTEFDDTVKAEAERALGLAHESMKAFSHTAELLSNVAARDEAVTDYFHQVLKLEQEELEEGEDQVEKENRTVKKFREALTHAPGQELFKGTWWNTFNGVSYTVDHVMGRTNDNRLHSAWYGKGKGIKDRALNLAVDYAKAS